MRKIAILLAVLLLTAAFPVSAAQFLDTDGTIYEKPILLLSDLGILKGRNDNFYEPEGTVTRAEAAAIVTRVSNVGAMQSDAQFSDVPTSHWAYKEIGAAAGLGIINGLGDGTFLPDASVSTEQFVKMLLCLAGYQAKAEASGGYPAGYMLQGNLLGILDGVAVRQAATRGDVALMVYNILEVPVFEKENYSVSSGTYLEGDTVLKRFLKVDLVSGLLTADDSHAFRENTRQKAGKVVIGSTIYLTGAKDTSDYFGMQVKAYVRENTEEWEIVSITPNKNVKTIEILTENIQPESTKTSLRFFRGALEKAETFGVQSDAKLVINGAEKEDWDLTTLTEKAGNLTLIANDGSTADVLLLEVGTTYVADSYSAVNEVIRTKPVKGVSQPISLKQGDVYDEYTIVDENGQAQDPKVIEEWDVLTVYGDKVSRTCKIVYSKAKVSGTATEIVGTEYVMIDGKNYRTDKNFFADYDIALGHAYTFCMDIQNRIVAAYSDEETTIYAYTITASKKEGLNDQVYVKLLTEADGVVTYKLCDNIYINGVRIDASIIFNPSRDVPIAQRREIDELMNKDKIKEQLVVIQKNDKNEITEFKTAAEGARPGSDQDRAAKFSLDAKNLTGGFYNAGLMCCFATKYYLKNTKLFNVADKYTGSNDYEYTVKDISYLGHGITLSNVDLYDTDALNRPKVMVMKAVKSDSEVFTGKAGVITAKATGLSGDGMPCTTLTIAYYGAAAPQVFYDEENVDAKYKKYVITDEENPPETIKLSKVEIGDIVILNANEKNVIKNAVVLFRKNTPISEGEGFEKGYKSGGLRDTSEGEDYFDLTWSYVYVTAAENGIFKYVKPFERVRTYSDGASGTKIYLYDAKRGTIEKTDGSSIDAGTKLVALRSAATEILFVIYK